MSKSLLNFCSEAEIKAYQTAEKEKRGKSVCLVVMNNNVYDATEFLPDHPGGEDLIRDFAGGQDMTGGFDSAGHSKDAHEKLDELKIGTLNPAQKSDFPLTASSSSSAPAASSAKSSGNNQLVYGAIIVAVAVVIGIVLKKNKFF
jgi:cytochrome b5